MIEPLLRPKAWRFRDEQGTALPSVRTTPVGKTAAADSDVQLWRDGGRSN